MKFLPLKLKNKGGWNNKQKPNSLNKDAGRP